MSVEKFQSPTLIRKLLRKPLKIEILIVFEEKNNNIEGEFETNKINNETVDPSVNRVCKIFKRLLINYKCFSGQQNSIAREVNFFFLIKLELEVRIIFYGARNEKRKRVCN